MEPKRRRLRHNGMFADTAAIATLGTELRRLSADLDAVAAALPGVAPACAAALGPVGAEFMTALTTALDATAQWAARLSAALDAAAGAAAGGAAAYIGAEQHAVAVLAI